MKKNCSHQGSLKKGDDAFLTGKPVLIVVEKSPHNQS